MFRQVGHRETLVKWLPETDEWDVWSTVEKHIQRFTAFAASYDVTPEWIDGAWHARLPENPLEYHFLDEEEE